MKKKHIYVIVPLIALVVFTAYSWSFSLGYKAVEMALQEQEKRKAARLAKEADETKRKDERQAAYQARDAANLAMSQNREKAERLEKEVAVTKEQIAKIVSDEKILRNDKIGNDAYVAKAQENVRELATVIEKIQKADTATLAARAAAAAAAAKAKKS